MIKLFASDLDGTLLQNGSQEVPEEIFPLLRQLKERGCLFAAASGRQYANLRRLFAPVKDDIAYICENGALVVYEEQIISTSVMEPALAREIMSAILESDGCEVMLSTPRMIYLQPKHPSFVRHMTEVVKNDITVVNDIFSVKEPAIKISAYHPQGTEVIAPYFEKRFSHKAAVVSSVDCWLDTMDLRCNKGTAMSALTARLQISASEVMAVGDNYNDVEMLDFAGHPVAMDNAQPALLSSYPCHTPSVEALLKELLCSAD